jgi:hypothetical protein
MPESAQPVTVKAAVAFSVAPCSVNGRIEPETS